MCFACCRTTLRAADAINICSRGQEAGNKVSRRRLPHRHHRLGEGWVARCFCHSPCLYGLVLACDRSYSQIVLSLWSFACKSLLATHVSPQPTIKSDPRNGSYILNMTAKPTPEVFCRAACVLQVIRVCKSFSGISSESLLSGAYKNRHMLHIFVV